MIRATLILILMVLAACASDTDAPPSGDNTDNNAPTNNAPVGDGEDTDGDGLPDFLEDRNANGRYDEGTNETDFQNPDTDGDGLTDGEEDANTNGRTDPGESDPREADTDGDTIDDGTERQMGTDPTLADTDGDGLRDNQERTANTNPLVPDTDGDGVLDGDEDRNGDGVLDPGETDPNVTDTDGDGTPDGEENVALACASARRAPHTFHEDERGDWSLVLGQSFENYNLVTLPGGLGRVQAATFGSTDGRLHGLIVMRPASPNAQDAQTQSIDDANALGQNVGISRNLQTRLMTAWDGYPGAISQLELGGLGGAAASTVRDEALAALVGVEPDELMGLPAASGPALENAAVSISTVYRTPQRVVTILAVANAATLDSDEALALAWRDVTDGTAAGQIGDALTNGCDPLEPLVESAQVDLLWVVDSSLSMKDDQEAVANAADAFFGVIANTDLSFRMGVTSADNRQNLWTIDQTGFTNDPAAFRAAMLDPPGRDAEFGLSTGLNVINYASGNIWDPHQLFRPEASRVVVFFSDEDDFEIKTAAADDPLCDPNQTPPFADCPTMQDFIDGYLDNDITAFAITGDPPGGCQAMGGPGLSEEAGHGYIQTALATGGSFGSICAPSLQSTFEDIIQASYGVASAYQLSHAAISSTLKVVVGTQEVPRSRVNGFDYDPFNQTLLFYGQYRPELDDEVTASYLYFADLTPDPNGPEDPVVD